MKKLTAAYGQLAGVLERTEDTETRLQGALRIGLPNPAAGGPHLLEIVRHFEARLAGCSVETVMLPFADRYGPLRRGEIAAMVTRLPLRLHDVVVGPILAHEPQALAVAAAHPLETRSTSRRAASRRVRGAFLLGPAVGGRMVL